MSAFAAVLHAGREPADAAAVAAMCAAASCSAATGARLEVRPGIAIGGCGGAEPAQVVAESGGVIVAADARIDNRRELLAELGRQPEPPAGEAALLLAAYHRWGEAFVDRLAGDFAFVLWDAAAGRLLGARDPLGMRSLHYARAGRALLVASEAQQLLAHPAMSRRIDEGTVAAYLVSHRGKPDRSFWVGARALPPGHRLVSRAGHERVTRYWRPEEIELQSMDLGEASERFRALLWQAVEDRLPAGAGACGLLLSGGLDSSALAAVVVDPAAREPVGRRLVPFAIDCETLAGCDESEYRQALAAHLGIAIESIRGEVYGMLDREPRQWPETPFVGWQPPTEEALERLRLRRGEVLLTGLGGDAVVAGSACVYADRLRRGRLGVVREMAEHAAVRGGSTAGVLRYWGLRPLLPRPFRRHLAGRDGPGRYPEWIEPRWARAVGLERRCWEHVAEPRFGSRARRVIHSLHRSLEAEQRAAQWYRRLAARHGIHVRHPYLDRRLVELVLATPPELLFRAGRYKWLLRQALGHRLPARVRERVGKTGYGAYLDASCRRRAAWIRDLMRSCRLAELGVVRGGRLRHELEDYLEGRSARLRPYVWFIITTELWLKRYAEAAGGGSRVGRPMPVTESGAS